MIYPSNPQFEFRFVNPQFLTDYLCKYYSAEVKIIGKSANGFSIVMLTIGNSFGKKVLAWSQMHGNESNATLAMLDILYRCNETDSLKNEIFGKISLDFIFMLNPDGAEQWTRRNAAGIDLNRDFNKLASFELPILKEVFSSQQYDFALNLHEQRTIFSTDGIHPATLSFLAPSADEMRTVNETRKKAMQIIALMNEDLQKIIPNRIGRYTDEFYPNAVGDNFTAAGVPVILFEGGHSPNDYYRKETRACYAFALEKCLRLIGESSGDTRGYEKYFDIPENQASHYDIIYRNVSLPGILGTADIAVQFQEVKKPEDEEIFFIPLIAEIGDCGKMKGWKEVDCTGKVLKPETILPKINEAAQFEFVD